MFIIANHDIRAICHMHVTHELDTWTHIPHQVYQLITEISEK